MFASYTKHLLSSVIDSKFGTDETKPLTTFNENWFREWEKTGKKIVTQIGVEMTRFSEFSNLENYG